MRNFLILLLFLGTAACTSNAVPVNIDLPDEQVTALSSDRSASLEVQLDDDLVSVWRWSPSYYDCQFTAILMRNTEVTSRFTAILEQGDAPIGYARIVQEYPEIAREMQCTDGPDSLTDDLDLLEIEGISPGQYTLFVLVSIDALRDSCIVTTYPITVKANEPNIYLYSRDLTQVERGYNINRKRCDSRYG